MKQRVGLVCGVLVAVLGAGYGCSNAAPNPPPERGLGLPAPPPELDAIVSAWARACQPGFSGDPSAPAFDPNQAGPHPLVFVAQDGTSHPLNGIIPHDWRPKDASLVQFVACVTDVTPVTVNSCDYQGTSSATIKRISRQLTVNLVSTQSGAEIPYQFGGSDPAVCPFSYDSEPHDIVGGLPDPATIKDGVVDRYVPVPACGGARPYASCLHCWQDVSEAAPNGCGPSAGPNESTTETLQPVRTGQPVTLDWEWKSGLEGIPVIPYNPFYSPAIGYFWSQSHDAAVLSTLEGAEVVATPTVAGSYSFLAQAHLPATDTGLTVQDLNFELEVRDKPIITDVLGVPAPVIVRCGQPTGFRFQVQGRPDGGRPGETLRWVWTEKPPGSAVGDPIVPGAQYDAQWTMGADVAGEYRVQLEYNDGLGFSDPLVSLPITAVSGPVLAPIVDKTAMVGEELSLYVDVSHQTDGLLFHWTLSSKPAASTLDIEDVVRQDLNVLFFTADVPGVYVLDITAVDNLGSSAPGHLTVTAQ